MMADFIFKGIFKCCYSRSNSCADGQIFYRSVLPSYYIQTTHNIIINYALSGSKHVCLLRDNALSHIYNYINKLVKQFLKLEKCYRLNTPTILSKSSSMRPSPFYKTYTLLIWSLLQVPATHWLSHQSVP